MGEDLERGPQGMNGWGKGRWGRCRTGVGAGVHKHPPSIAPREVPSDACPRNRPSWSDTCPGSFLSRANTGVSWGWGGAGGGELNWGQGLGKRPRGRGPWTISCLLCPLLHKGAASSCGKLGIYIQ